MKKHILALLALINARFQRGVQLANETAATGFALIGLANEVAIPKTGEAITQCVVPYGNHDHAQGLQVFDKAAAVEMANEFNTLFANAKRALGFGGLPVYVGHPDHPAFANEYKDKRAVGWVKEMTAGDDGLRVGIAFTTRGVELIANEEFKFISPNWYAKPVAGKSKQYRPSRMKSIGLTNDPEIPVGPIQLANEAGGMAVPAWLCTALGIAADSTEEAAQAALTAQLAAAKEKPAADVLAANEKTARETAEQALANEKTARTTAETALANERGLRAGMLIAAAIAAKRTTPADEPKWKEKFTADFAAAEIALANEKAVAALPAGAAKTKGLGARRETSSAAAKMQELANEALPKHGGDYTRAWLAVKADPANAALLLAMKTPAAA